MYKTLARDDETQFRIMKLKVKGNFNRIVDALIKQKESERNFT